VFALLIVCVVVAVPVLYAADRIIKARAQTRRLRTMSERLDAVTERTDKKLKKRQDVAKASAELTSLIPAINHPPLSLRDEPVPAEPAPGDPALDKPAFDEPALAEAEPDRPAPDEAVPDVAVRETGPDATAVLGTPLAEPGPAEATRDDQEPCTADPVG